MIFKVLIFSLCLKVVLSLYNGAPTAACTTLIPTHGSQLPIDIPVQFSLSANVVRAGYPLTVSIQSLPGTVFGDFFYRGFMFQARLAGSSLPIASQVVGTWDIATGTRYADCPQLAPQSTLTHSINNDRDFTQLIWRAPHTFTGDFIMVNIHYTIVMNVGLFWHVVSPPIRVEHF